MGGEGSLPNARPGHVIRRAMQSRGPHRATILTKKLSYLIFLPLLSGNWAAPQDSTTGMEL
jgi:hypothetical protein